jgi:hypothetical protein
VKNELKGGEVYNGAHITEIQNCPRQDIKLSRSYHTKWRYSIDGSKVQTTTKKRWGLLGTPTSIYNFIS